MTSVAGIIGIHVCKKLLERGGIAVGVGDLMVVIRSV